MVVVVVVEVERLVGVDAVVRVVVVVVVDVLT